MTNRLHPQHNAAALLAMLLAACAPAVPSEPAPDASAARTEALAESATIRPLQPCVPSSLGFTFRDDDTESFEQWEPPQWEQGSWFHNRTILEEQVRYELAGPIWQTTAVTESRSYVDWDMGVQAVDRAGQPEVIEIRILARATDTGDGASAPGTDGALPNWTCTHRAARDWSCRLADDRSAPATGWPDALPNPAQLFALLPPDPPARGVFSLPANQRLDGMGGPEEGNGRVRLGRHPDSGHAQRALLVSLSGTAPDVEVLDDLHDGEWTGHVLLLSAVEAAPSMRACWNIQASGQRTDEPPLGHWTVTRAAHLDHVSIPASVPRL